MDGHTEKTETQETPMVITQPIHLALVCILAGEFPMGSDPAQDKWARSHEQPQHRVYVSKFYIGKYPVTNVQFATFLKATGYAAHAKWQSNRFPAGEASHPAIYVSWHDAVAFCHWLRQETDLPFRLPTEAEREKAARGIDGRLYPWGDQWHESRLNYGYFIRGLISFVLSFAAGTTPVNQYSPGGDSPYGAADMSGNVWEWCADWYGQTTYQQRAGEVVKDPLGPEKGRGRVMRGGSWYLGRGFTRCAVRFGTDPENRWNDLGFRVALTG